MKNDKVWTFLTLFLLNSFEIIPLKQDRSFTFQNIRTKNILILKTLSRVWCSHFNVSRASDDNLVVSETPCQINTFLLSDSIERKINVTLYCQYKNKLYNKCLTKQRWFIFYVKRKKAINTEYRFELCCVFYEQSKVRSFYLFSFLNKFSFKVWSYLFLIFRNCYL